jgi:hypothetical protein
MSNKCIIFLAKEQSQVIKSQLVVRMIEFVLSLQELPAVPACAKGWTTDFERASAFLQSVDKFIPKDATSGAAYRGARSMMLSSTL